LTQLRGAGVRSCRIGSVPTTAITAYAKAVLVEDQVKATTQVVTVLRGLSPDSRVAAS
jgi:hypothetical protein